MKNNSLHILILFIFIFLFSGCDTFPGVRYSLGTIDSFSKISTDHKLCSDLRSLFAKRKLLTEKKPKTKDILCVFSGENKVGLESYALLVGAMRDQGQIMVDIQSINTDIKKIKKAVSRMLSDKYPKHKVIYE